MVTIRELALASGEAFRFAETLRVRDGYVAQIDLIMDTAKLPVSPA